jgi:hypothetical protein
MNTSYPARIVSFDPVTQTAVVKLMIERYFSNLDEEYIVLPTQELVDVPCHFPRGGGYSITMPVVVGDDCLVFFAQRGIDHWLYEGVEETGGLLERPSPQHKRRNSLSDALALIGFGSGIVAEEPLVIKEYNIDAIELRNEDRSQRVSLVVDTGNIEINTSTYDKLNVPVEGEADAVLQASSSIVMAKDGLITIDSLVSDTNQTLVINVEKDIIATTGDSVLTLKHDGTVTLVCSTSLDVTTPTSTFNGDMHCTGTITADVDCIADGISLVSHVHSAGTYKDAEARPITLKSGAPE